MLEAEKFEYAAYFLGVYHWHCYYEYSDKSDKWERFKLRNETFDLAYYEDCKETEQSSIVFLSPRFLVSEFPHTNRELNAEYHTIYSNFCFFSIYSNNTLLLSYIAAIFSKLLPSLDHSWLYSQALALFDHKEISEAECCDISRYLRGMGVSVPAYLAERVHLVVEKQTPPPQNANSSPPIVLVNEALPDCSGLGALKEVNSSAKNASSSFDSWEIEPGSINVAPNSTFFPPQLEGVADDHQNQRSQPRRNNGNGEPETVATVSRGNNGFEKKY